MNTEQKIYHTLYGVSERALEIVDQAERALATRFQRLQSIRTANQLKVLHAMQKNSLSQADFFSATGYGYGDVGRDKTERIFRDVFRAEDAIMRASIASGTHALATVLFSLLERGDRLLAVTGHPYDTLQEVIGIRGKEIGTLLEKGVIYDAVPFVDGKPDYQEIEAALQKNVKLIEIQRSTGYTDRRALTITEIQNLIQHIRAVRPDVLILVDNCYGEFTEEKEPLEVGADVIAGSLIKNPGGGIAVSGGYIAGKKEIITRCINHLTAPGLGKDTGLTFGTTRTTLQGLFFAPHITMEALRGALLFAKTYESMGFRVIPASSDPRSDIIEAIELRDGEKVIAFCRAVQKAASVGSDAVPYPWDMPGYSDPVIMASGGFIDGSSIEVSADGPMREPYMVYYQGGVVYEQAKLACLLTVDAIQ